MRWLLILLLLSGCATRPPVAHPEHVEVSPFAMNGRISVKHEGHRDSAGLHWQHELKSDEILLLNPLGQTAARIYSDEASATLDEGNRHYSDSDVESLMMQVLGWRMQLASLHHWVLGVEAEGPSIAERDELGRLTVLRQDGWEVRYLAYAEEKSGSMPSRIQLTRDKLQMTLLIDEWEWNPNDK